MVKSSNRIDISCIRIDQGLWIENRSFGSTIIFDKCILVATINRYRFCSSTIHLPVQTIRQSRLSWFRLVHLLLRQNIRYDLFDMIRNEILRRFIFHENLVLRDMNDICLIVFRTHYRAWSCVNKMRAIHSRHLKMISMITIEKKEIYLKNIFW